MNFLPSIHEALSNLLAAKLRSILALLGVWVGTASVVAMVSCGQLATHQALKQFETLGTDLLSVNLYSEDEKIRDYQKQNLTVNALKGLTTLVPAIQTVSPYSQTFAPITYQGKEIHGDIVGATENLQTTIH